MTIKIAVTGKSGSGKTTISKSLFNVIKEKFPEKSILLFDNDLSGELGRAFLKDVRNTIYGIRSGKHEYKTGIPQHMTKQEYVEWAMEDIIQPIDDNVDLIVSWLVGSKDCRCPITGQINYALKRLINRYDFVIFDCEFDLKYLNQLVDVDIDLALIVAIPSIESITLAERIEDYSAKYAANGQIGVLLNKVENQDLNEVQSRLKANSLEIIGAIPFDNSLSNGSIEHSSLIVDEALKHLYSRLNLPQENGR